MLDLSKTDLSIDFETVGYQGKTMSLTIINDGDVWCQTSMPEGWSSWNKEVILPTKVTLVFGNHDKNSNRVNEDGSVDQMSIRIKSIKMDGMSCWEYFPESFCITECNDSDDIILGSTMCVNGKMELLFNEDNAFTWLVKSKLG